MHLIWKHVNGMQKSERKIPNGSGVPYKRASVSQIFVQYDGRCMDIEGPGNLLKRENVVNGTCFSAWKRLIR
jgi:hypothetical protein